MSKIRFKRLKSVSDLENYQNLTRDKVGVKFPEEYLERAQVVGLQDASSGRLHGGFLIAHQGPLRCIEQLPEEVLRDNAELSLHRDQCFEINGLWLNSQSAPDGSRLRLYLRLMEEAVKVGIQGKSKYVYAYNAENVKLRKFYKNFHSTEIYEGPVKVLSGMEEAGRERVEMGCMKKLPLTVLRNPGFLMQRAFGHKLSKFRWI